MKAILHKTYFLTAVLGISLLSMGCERDTRARTIEDRTKNPGSINEPKNTGDTRAKTLQDGQSPSASPTGRSKDTPAVGATAPEASGPAIDPQKKSQP